MVELIDEADLHAADRGALAIGEPARFRARRCSTSPAVGPLEQPGDVEKRRLAGAGRRDQRDHLAGIDVEVGAVENLQSGLSPSR